MTKGFEELKRISDIKNKWANTIFTSIGCSFELLFTSEISDWVISSATSLELYECSIASIIPLQMLLIVELIVSKYLNISSLYLSERGIPPMFFYSFFSKSSCSWSWYPSILPNELIISLFSLSIASLITLAGLSLLQSSGFLGGIITLPSEWY